MKYQRPHSISLYIHQTHLPRPPHSQWKPHIQELRQSILLIDRTTIISHEQRTTEKLVGKDWLSPGTTTLFLQEGISSAYSSPSPTYKHPQHPICLPSAWHPQSTIKLRPHLAWVLLHPHKRRILYKGGNIPPPLLHPAR